MLAAIAVAGCGGGTKQETGPDPTTALPSNAVRGDGAQSPPQSLTAESGAAAIEAKAPKGDGERIGDGSDRKEKAEPDGLTVDRILQAAEDQGVEIVRSSDGEPSGPVARILEQVEGKKGPASRKSGGGAGLVDQILEELTPR